MKALFIIIMGIHAIQSEPENRNAFKVVKLSKKCEAIKCPAVEDPHCMRLVHNMHRNITLHIIVANKCEMKYAECLGGYSAKFVPIKYCEHESLHKINQTNNSFAIRNKRSTEADSGDESKETDLPEGPVLTDPAADTCPRQCPTRNVMLCAQCQHGIYRSFLSVCHMKKYMCNHKDEELQLVGRYPCAFSSPYLSDPFMTPMGRDIVPEDDDPVIRFLLCKAKHYVVNDTMKLPESFLKDPECQFNSQEQVNKFPIPEKKSEEDTSLPEKATDTLISETPPVSIPLTNEELPSSESKTESMKDVPESNTESIEVDPESETETNSPEASTDNGPIKYADSGEVCANSSECIGQRFYLNKDDKNQ